ncbi:PilZ domain-containing protein [Leptolyngbya sp. 15MV]|nr:PilZ domain-containing protein [Leptolyngbya sp. 15MV]
MSTRPLTVTLSPPTNERKSGRILVCALATNLGEAVDISAGGIRVVAPRAPRPGSLVTLQIGGLDGSVIVGARVVWTKRQPRGYDVGLEFVELTQEQREQIRAMAISARRH